MSIDVEGKRICITGALSMMTRQQVSERLEELGAIVSPSVTKTTDMLFCGERAGSKLAKAESLGIPVYRESEFAPLLSREESSATKEVRSAAASGAAPMVLREIADGEVVEVQGSAREPYKLTNTGGVYSCSCPAWRNQSVAIDVRSCKHLAKIRGAEAESARVGRAVAKPKVAKLTASKVLLAQKWETHVDPQGYWLSEKLDGVRAIWDGKSFFSRQGNPFHAPDWFTDGFPDHPLDGELWIGRGEFQKTVSVARRQDKGPQWKEIRYVVFDAPEHGGNFEERMEYMFGELKSTMEYASILDQILCRGVDHLREELARVEGLGGEGLMLREPASPYVAGRSHTLLKVKSFHDAEAKVVGYKDGQGRHKNRVGALELVNAEGVRFFAGTGLSDAERENPPAIGTLVTYRYQELTDAGVPRFPTYVGERIDGEDFDVEAVQKSAKKASAQKSGTKKRASAAAPSAPFAGTRRFESASSSGGKFWEISVDGNTHTVRYGKLGSSGSAKTKEFASEEAARADADKLIRKKTGKGYEEV